MKGQFSVARQPFQPITHIALTRQAIVETSLQRFDDEDPCIIHETHCRHWLALALMEQLQCHHGEQLGRPMAIGQLHPTIRKVLAYDDGETIVFT
ncbi:hypothetical protein [Anoxynatronum sibiricum]|uniref:Uncharacterized protein n=1 Tax=Anoxynatronum sibiricum TaxID=210623 RepID=A0ABU9VY75_9CLOT